MRKQNSENGAVFLYILLGISLLAALTYAVSSGNRANVGALTDEQAKLAAQEIIDYGNTVANAVQKLRLRGCSDTEISFENDIVSGYNNPNSPLDNSCHIFDQNGGNINFKIFNEAHMEPLLSNPVNPFLYFSSESAFKGFGEDCATNQCTDLVAYTLIKQNICLVVNDSVGVSDIPQDSDLKTNLFSGSYTASSPTLVLDEPANNKLAGKLHGCFYENDASPNHVFYQILIAR